eukprot:184061-Amphidinium_carterae.1
MPLPKATAGPVQPSPRLVALVITGPEEPRPQQRAPSAGAEAIEGRTGLPGPSAWKRDCLQEKQDNFNP